MSRVPQPPLPPHPPPTSTPRLVLVAGLAVLVTVAGLWWWSGAKSQDANAAKKGPAPIPVVTAKVEQRDVPVTLRANGTVVAIQKR